MPASKRGHRDAPRVVGPATPLVAVRSDEARLESAVRRIVESQPPPHFVVAEADGRVWALADAPRSEAERSEFLAAGLEPCCLDGLWQFRPASAPDLSLPPFCRSADRNPFRLADVPWRGTATRHLLLWAVSGGGSPRSLEAALAAHAAAAGPGDPSRAALSEHAAWLSGALRGRAPSRRDVVVQLRVDPELCAALAAYLASVSPGVREAEAVRYGMALLGWVAEEARAADEAARSVERRPTRPKAAGGRGVAAEAELTGLQSRQLRLVVLSGHRANVGASIVRLHRALETLGLVRVVEVDGVESAVPTDAGRERWAASLRAGKGGARR